MFSCRCCGKFCIWPYMGLTWWMISYITYILSQMKVHRCTIDIICISSCLYMLALPAYRLFIDHDLLSQPIIWIYCNFKQFLKTWMRRPCIYAWKHIFHVSSHHDLHACETKIFISFLIASISVHSLSVSSDTSPHIPRSLLIFDASLYMHLLSKFMFHHFILYCFLQKGNAMHPPKAPKRL